MGRMIFDLTDEDRASLEALRAARGHRSQAETLRTLIRESVAGGWVTVGVVEAPGPTKVVELTPLPADAPRFVKGTCEPTPKPFKTRLKGEWKAP